MTDKRTEIAIIGGGIAGLTTAWSLQKEGYSNVTVLEKNSETTMEASGLNTGLLQHYLDSYRIRRELRRGISLLDSFQKRHNTSFFDPCPSLWAVSKDRYLKLEEDDGNHLDWKKISHHDVSSQFDAIDKDNNRCWISFSNDALLNSLKMGNLLQQELEHSSVTVRTGHELKSGFKSADGWKLKFDKAKEKFANLIINADCYQLRSVHRGRGRSVTWDAD